jgi:thiol-disulfide isomerase/thioredoxin
MASQGEPAARAARGRAAILLLLAATLLLGTPPAHPAVRELRDVGRAAGPQVGDLAPEVLLETLDGDRIDVAQLKGRVVMLDFWATWCAPCLAAVPALKRLSQGLSGRSFTMVSISGDRKGGRLREFVTNHELGWTQCWDGNGEAQRLFGVRGFPTYVVLDRSGRIRYLDAGWNRRIERELSRQIEQALADARGPASPTSTR